jgi:hypothetical protein
MVLIMSSAVGAAPRTTEEFTLQVTRSDAPVRLDAKESSAVVAKVKLGAVLTSEAKYGEWYRVNLPADEDGFVISGYIHRSDVNVLEGEEEIPQTSLNKELFKETIKVRVVSQAAEIRENPDKTSQLMGEAPHNSELETDMKQGEWFRVKVAANVYGFIHQEHLEPMDKPLTHGIAEVSKPEQEEQPESTPYQAAQASASTQNRRITLKLTLGYGFGFESIETGAYKIYDDRTEPITLHPGGGGNFGVDVGYLITRSLKLELGIGYQNSGVIAGEEQVTFSRMPLALTLTYELPSQRSYNIYLGGGGGLYNGAEVKYEVDNMDINVKYKSSFGIHGLVGFIKRSKSRKWFWFGELKYVSVFKYQWTKATYSGMAYILYSSNPYAEFGANGIFLNFGIGWFF